MKQKKKTYLRLLTSRFGKSMDTTMHIVDLNIEEIKKESLSLSKYYLVRYFELKEVKIHEEKESGFPCASRIGVLTKG